MKYSKKQIADLLESGMVSQEEVDKMVKSGKWEISQGATYTRKEKEFFNNNHKKYWEALQTAKKAAAPLLDEIKSLPEVVRFLQEWGEHEDENGKFSISIQLYWSGANRAEKVLSV